MGMQRSPTFCCIVLVGALTHTEHQQVRLHALPLKLMNLRQHHQLMEQQQQNKMLTLALQQLGKVIVADEFKGASN